MSEFIYTREPPSVWTPVDFDDFLKEATERGCSDILLVPRNPVWVRLHGRWVHATRRPVTSEEISMLVDLLARNRGAAAQVISGFDQDFSYDLRVDRISRLRYRGSATGCRDGVSQGITLVLRAIQAEPPTVEDIDLESAILDAAFPNNGLVLVTGVMGSGKSTTLAALLRHIRETQPRHVLTYEHPIEFDLMGLSNAVGPLVQSEIPIHLESFTRAPRNAARRAADVILVGESRDPETLRGMLEAAEIGVAAYSTVHTRSAAETPSRIINVFPHEMHPQIAATLLASLRLIVQQRLEPRVGGGRVALREYLAFTPALRRELWDVPHTALIPFLQKKVRTEGRDILTAAKEQRAAGVISEETYERIRHEEEAGHVA